MRDRFSKYSKAPMLASGIVALVAALSASAQAQTYASFPVMTGLNNPRGLNFNPVNGGLYVAEAGVGGNGAGIASASDGTVTYGATSSVTQYLNGVQSRVVTGLPSLANTTTEGGANAVGLTDITFTSTGAAYGVIGLGGTTASRNTLTAGGAPGSSFGQVVQLNLTGNSFTTFADLTQYEAANNPDGGKLADNVTPDTDSNPYGLTTLPDGFAAVDAGGNDLLKISSTGAISTLATFAPQTNPSFPGLGGPTYQAVPTSVARGTDGTLYVGSLTGFPFPQGGANIYAVAPGGGVTTLTGFTNIIDIAYLGSFLYVLQYTTTGIVGPPSAGELFQVNPTTGTKTLLYSSPLLTPGGLAIGNNGTFYVTNLSTSPGGGQVIAITANAPEPGVASLILSGITLGVLPLVRRRRTAKSRKS